MFYLGPHSVTCGRKLPLWIGDRNSHPPIYRSEQLWASFVHYVLADVQMVVTENEPRSSVSKNAFL